MLEIYSNILTRKYVFTKYLASRRDESGATAVEYGRLRRRRLGRGVRTADRFDRSRDHRHHRGVGVTAERTIDRSRGSASIQASS